MSAEEAGVDLRERNRRVLWIWLAVAGVLVIASFVVGIKW
jgi:bacteriorhodopsin